MKRYILFSALLSYIISLSSQQKMQIYNSDRIMYETVISDIDSIKFQNSSSIFNFTQNLLTIPTSEIDSITFSNEATNTPAEEVIYIMYNQELVSTINPLSNNGVDILQDGAHVTINATSGIANIEYQISGKTSNGSLIINSDTPAFINISNCEISNPTGPAIHLSQNNSYVIKTTGSNNLADGSQSTQNAALLSEGSITFSGEGTLNITGAYKHAISCKNSVTVESGTIDIKQSATDGIHTEGFTMKGGKLDITSGSDGIDAGSGTIVITDGSIKMSLPADGSKGLKCDGIMTISGGNINLSVSGAQSKGISSKKDIYFNGGTINITASGKTVLESAGSGYDPSFCTAIKSDGNISINNTTIEIENTSTNNGGKGITADGDISIYQGNIKITTAGDGSTYTNESGATDSYTSACIKSKGDIYLMAGNIVCSSTGKGGKGISADGKLETGNTNAGNDQLILDVKTSGERFIVSGSSSGGGGQRPGGGMGDSGDYANPKAIKSTGNLTINSGTISVKCSQQDEGGEGIESKATITINGGDIEVSSYDDCINASTHIEINDGMIYCVATGNDAIDSNGTLTINGGLTIANGTRSPEGGIDCDNNRFTINGGTVIATGGSNSSPNAGTQKAIKYTSTAGNNLYILNSSNETVLLYQMPAYSSSGTGSGGGPGGGNSSSVVLLFSSPELKSGNSYTLKYGGTIEGGNTVNGYNTGGSYSGGSSKSFTVSSSIQTSI